MVIFSVFFFLAVYHSLVWVFFDSQKVEEEVRELLQEFLKVIFFFK